MTLIFKSFELINATGVKLKSNNNNNNKVKKSRLENDEDDNIAQWNEMNCTAESSVAECS